MTNKKSYVCSVCDFQWKSSKEYEKCPDCGSTEIFIEEDPKTPPESRNEDLIGQRPYRAGGRGLGTPRVCKCQQCGYEAPKTRGVPCRNTKCPECGAPLCGSD